MKKVRFTNGFTLIELLISISIFMVFVTVAGGTYTSLVKANKRANDMQKLYGELRFVLDTLATDIRSGEIDFQCLSQATQDPQCLATEATEQLAVIKKNGTERVIYRFDKEKHTLSTLHQVRNDPRLLFSSSEWKPLFGDSISIQELSFSVFPKVNPYAEENAGSDDVQFQPAVTIALKAGSFDFRTTYTSRMYGRTLIYDSLQSKPSKN